MFQFLLLSHAASLVVTDSPPSFFLKANEADCGFLHYSSYRGCYCIPLYPMTAIDEVFVLSKVIAMIVDKVKNKLCAESLPRFGIFRVEISPSKFMMMI